MKFIHLSDLHIGKRVNGFVMLEDQEYILLKIINIIDEQKPDCVIIAGDVYDKSVPPAEAVKLFDDFLVRLSQRNLKVFVISGNHDSPERIAFGGRLMNKSGIYMSPVYKGAIEPITLSDDYGQVEVFMLPFIKPANVRKSFPEQEIISYNDAVGVVIKNTPVCQANRNIIIAHQFITGATRSDSEDISVGGIDNIDAAIFDEFDYVALGHLHRLQTVTKDTIVYCGSPLKYSLSEANNEKSVVVVELLEKGNVKKTIIPLIPKRDMHIIKGKYEDLTLKSFYENTTYQNDYLEIVLTDEQEIPEVMGKLGIIYKNIMKISYDNKRTRAVAHITGAENVEQKSPAYLFEEFYEMQNNQPMNEEQKDFIVNLIQEIAEEQI